MCVVSDGPRRPSQLEPGASGHFERGDPDSLLAKPPARCATQTDRTGSGAAIPGPGSMASASHRIGLVRL